MQIHSRKMNVRYVNKLLVTGAPDEGSMGGAEDKRSPQSHLCDPGSIPILTRVCCWLSPFSEGFSPGSPVFLSP